MIAEEKNRSYLQLNILLGKNVKNLNHLFLASETV